MHPDSVPQSTNEQQQTTTAQPMPMPASDEQTMTRPPLQPSATPATAREKLEEWVTGDGYDAVLGIGLFTDVYDNNRGWRIALSSTKGTALANANAIRVAPIGVFNVGKTWLIKKICGESIGLSSASALDKHTESLSIKMGKLSADHNVVFLDTAGLNSPVTSVTSLGRLLGTTKMDPMKAMEGMLQELTRQANFVREVAFEFGQVFLMVLGQISHHDQQELLQLVQLAERHGSKKHVVVVHNLKKLSYAEFMTPDPTTGKTYVEMMSSIFALTPSEHKMGLNDKTFIRELHGVFGSEKSAVHMRHLFMTRDDANDADCRNEWVVKRIRDLIDQGTPTMGNVLVDIARIASNCAKKMVHLPPGNAAEIRYHSQRSVFLGGLVTDDERLRLEKERKEPPKDPRVDALEVQLAALQAELANGNADEATQAALREQMHEADIALSNARVEMARRNKLTVVDASTLVPLTVAVEAAPIALGGGGGSSSSRSTVKFNVTRSKVVSASGPCWAVHVHMTVAGLMAGEVARLRSVLQWESGCYLEAPTPQHPETLKISFRARVAPMAAKQMASLNQHGRVCGNSLGGVIAVNPNSLPVVVEAGNRPFPTTEAAVGAAREGLHDDGTYDLDVAVHTRVDSVMYDYEPRVTYACGVLTVTVLAEPSDTDRTDPANANWLESAELQLLPEVNGKDALAFDENDLTE